MHKPRTVRWDLLTSKEAWEYLQHNDLAILPVACIEMHGPIVPLGCDLFLDLAFGSLLAEKWGCVMLPPIPYVYPGASGPWPGTIDVGPEISIQYMKAVALAAIRAGLKRLVLSGMHGPVDFMGTAVIRAIYQETGHAVALFSGYEACLKALKEEFGWAGEDLLVLGALRVLGLHKHMRPETDVNIEMTAPLPSLAALQALRIRAPWIYSKDSQHTGIHSRLTRKDADRAAACIRKAVDRMADAPALFEQYQREMAAMNENPPWKASNPWST